MQSPITREAGPLLTSLRAHYPVITLTGPRQSGKTTLCRIELDDLPYANLETPDERARAAADPRAFLGAFPHGAVIDEFQRVPELASYIQAIVDEREFNGTFVLTGSQNLSVRNTVSQSLVGRTALLSLLPFSCAEVGRAGADRSNDALMFRGFYPRIYDRDLNPSQALGDYVGTYVERDLRQLSSVHNLSLFQKFMGLCAGRIGQLLNLGSLGNDTGIAQPTAREWLTLLEASYIVFRLPPFFANIGKRLVKTPKLYFYDVGLAAHLLGITDISQIPRHPLRGMLFENMVVVEVMKYFLNRGPRRDLWFYRDSNGTEVDLLISNGPTTVPVEIKAATTIAGDFFTGLKRVGRTVSELRDPVLVYGGDCVFTHLDTRVTGIHGLSGVLQETVST
jgi:uncharacterized protein